ncbi:hypothetical protein PHYBLDRAFT_65927 [Phycomyces blakesleeanus NRRL 1555(-)]|uniref:Uncharacterized protein n=1 Tax=Phycomyces blakesleeanus (strain ATCC 8743b / DSM 1359 / FGSC 10004 / NBRC 33097 / NRRL 1555) TaxID=763407 RepID=A0A167MMW6_PHYB8|nr:hypothetical protein PHYBLDRAFT_65927 [Phycomyces blakesleeanus NRRL 1555(-)]OAD73319.1 hypothetical protein PHYBLDRAFT_65927 [Phycomyces blakesleeanus NRRL 1555(-)]|eukprot:XP_018291359.1 hypothetical protein PHYBLDRAFT_65927 [Phycomyces blakesleeanus NRRL 1555(-)]
MEGVAQLGDTVRQRQLPIKTEIEYMYKVVHTNFLLLNILALLLLRDSVPISIKTPFYLNKLNTKIKQVTLQVKNRLEYARSFRAIISNNLKAIIGNQKNCFQHSVKFQLTKRSDCLMSNTIQKNHERKVDPTEECRSPVNNFYSHLIQFFCKLRYCSLNTYSQTNLQKRNVNVNELLFDNL